MAKEEEKKPTAEGPSGSSGAYSPARTGGVCPVFPPGRRDGDAEW